MTYTEYQHQLHNLMTPTMTAYGVVDLGHNEKSRQFEKDNLSKVKFSGKHDLDVLFRVKI